MGATRIFYGWYVVAAVLVITTATSGFAFYNLSLLLAAFAGEYGFPVSLVSAATATFFVAGGIGGLIAGRLVDRMDARIVIVAGATLGALTLSLAGSMREPWMLFLFHLVFGLCHGATSLVPVTTVVARWFQVRRALAFSIASSGLSLGGILVIPINAYAIQHYGLAAAAPWMGLALFLGVVPVTILLLRPSPAAMGLQPDGAAAPAAGDAPVAPMPAIAFSDALRSRYFHAVSIAYLFLLGAQVAAISHLYRLASTRVGFETAALAVSVFATCSTFGRFGGGWLLFYVRTRPFALGLMLTQVLALALFALAEQRLAIIACAMLFGATIGNSLMMQPLLLAEHFGTRDYGRIYALSQMITTVGIAGCPALVGLLYDTSGGYRVPFFVIAGITLLGLLTLFLGTSAKPAAPRSA
jgi:MFS family permease